MFRHPCIIRVYGVCFGDETRKPSMLLSLEKTSLDAAIKNGELNNEQKNRITVEIVLGMRYIHKLNYMHRDLKPLDILLSKKNHVRISDFSIAKEDRLDESQTKGIGTLRFMAPELYDTDDDNHRYTKKIDVYSFGITLIYIVTGTYPPFSLRSVVSGEAPNLPDNIPQWVNELIQSCLSLDPEKRPSFAEIFDILKENNFDLFSSSKGQKLNEKQLEMKKEIESRIEKIEAFELKHQ